MTNKISKKGKYEIEGKLVSQEVESLQKDLSLIVSLKNDKKQTKLSVSKQNMERFLNKKNSVIFIDSSDGELIFFIVYVTKSKIVSVTKATFTSYDGMFHIWQNRKFKFSDGTRIQQQSFLRQIDFNRLSAFKGEGLVDLLPSSITDFFSGLMTSIQVIGTVGKVKRFMNNRSFELLALRISTVCLNVVKIISNGFSILSILELCVSLWSSLFSVRYAVEFFKAESLEQVLLATSLSFMPKGISEVLKKLQLLTNTKVLDNFEMVSVVVSYIRDFLKQVLSYLEIILPTRYYDWFDNLFDLQPTIIVKTMQSLYSTWRKDKLCILEESYRNHVKRINDDAQKMSEKLSVWFRKSPGANQINEDFKRLWKGILSYESSSRIEPVCFVYEGPPGCLKSVYVNKVISVLGVGSYAHKTESVESGKDWYDAYNNEEVFYMDDVGAKGISQWRNIVNFVSPVKTPLDCATAELKDTKFFCSEKILVTTNRFSDLAGLTRGDGIANLEALWRRGYVISFADVVRKGGYITGVVYFKYFDTLTKKWIKDFPKDLKEHFELNNVKIEPFCVVNEDSEFLFVAWLTLLVQLSSDLKKLQHSDNTFTKEDVDMVREAMKTFKSESESKVSTFDVLKDYVSHLKDFGLESLNMFLHGTSVIGDDYLSFAMIAAGVGILAFTSYTLISRLLSKDEVKPVAEIFRAENELSDKLEEFNMSVISRHPSITAIAKQVFQATFHYKETDADISTTCHVLLTNKFLITTSHTCTEDRCVVIVYKNMERNHRLIDGVNLMCVYRSLQDDVAIWGLPQNYPTPFKDVSHIFNQEGTKNRSPVLINTWGVYDLNTLLRENKVASAPYKITIGNKVITNNIKTEDLIYDKLHSDGMCGSPIVSMTGKFLGLHVAGHETMDIGVGLSFSNTTLSKIYDILQKGKSFFKIDCEISDKVTDNFSGIKIDDNFHLSTPHKSNLVPSPLHGIFPITRKPANLVVNGNHTVKDVAKKSFSPIKILDQDEIEFGKQVLSAMLEDFKPISMKETIQGNDLLSRINKKSSSGFGFSEEKVHYIDYENGVLKDTIKDQYELFKSNLSKGIFEKKDILWCETLKDELRNEDKILPRSFRVSTLLMQLVTKETFGEMVSNIVRERKINGVMIGVNPYVEWEEIHQEILTYSYIWAGDIGNWDGNMSPQVQNALNDVIISKFQGDKELASYILGFIPYCMVGLNDDTYLTTHSMPSGSFLTAIYNSLVNRFYTAMWFYRNYTGKPTVGTFNRLVMDKVYGDDKLNGIKGSEHLSTLNAVTMRVFFESIGMKFTDSKKKDIVKETQDLTEITFLKRSFVYHSQVGTIVGPLDLSTLYSTLSWLDESKEIGTIMQDKLHAFQREIYLHEGMYDACIDKLLVFCQEKGVFFKKLGTAYLKQLYIAKDYDYDDEKYGIKIPKTD